MEKIIAYKHTWDGYHTPCPYFNKKNDPTKIMVGSCECYNCEFNKNYLQKSKNNTVRCCYESENDEL